MNGIAELGSSQTKKHRVHVLIFRATTKKDVIGEAGMMLEKAINWLFWQFQKRCKHDGADVSVDITEGSAKPLEVAYCNRCGAIQLCYNHRLIQTALWRTPRATWTGANR